MTRTDLIAELRNVVNDVVAPYAWSDQRLISWLSEGQDRFCALTGFWQDATTYSITTVANQNDYSIPARAVAIKSIWDGTRPLEDFSKYEDLDFSDTEAARPMYYRLDQSTGKITLIGTISAGVVLTLKVHRKSLSPLIRKSSVIVLGGTFHAGDTVTVIVNGIVFSYTAQSGDTTLSGVATALGAVIAANTAYSVTVSGQSISVIAADAAVSTISTAQVSGTNATTSVAVSNVYCADPEVPEEFSNALVEYAAHKAYGDHDRELQNPVKSSDHYTMFMTYVRRGLAAHRAVTGDYTDVVPNPWYIV